MGLHIARAQAIVDHATERGLTLAGEHLEGVSRDLVPIEEGDLMRSSQTLTMSKGHVTVSYGGKGLDDYAVRQHEELTWQHAPGRQAKYLEAPFTAEAATMQAIIATTVRREVGK